MSSKSTQQFIDVTDTDHIFTTPSYYEAGRVDAVSTPKETKKAKAQVQASFLKQTANQLKAVLTALLAPFG